jgi:hypothetical protein
MKNTKTKTIWVSKTFWANLIAIVAIAVQEYTAYVIDLDIQIAALAIINMLLRMVTGKPVVWSKKPDTTVIRAIILVCMIATAGAIGTACSTMSQNGVSWVQEIKNWTPYQKANFFIDVWQAEHKAYQVQNAIEKKPAELINYLENKRKMLETAREPIRVYAQVINAGTAPDSGLEQEIITLIRELQMRAWGGA